MPTRVRKLAILMFALLCSLSLELNAQDHSATETSTPETKISIDKIIFEATTYDFGVVEEGTRVSQVFTFTNTSDEPLVLTDAKGSCGCTVPRWPRAPIMPGETASLTVEFNTKGKKGMRNQKVTLTANTNPPQIFLFLTGEVVIPDGATPTSKEAEEVLSADCFAIYPNPTAEVLKLEVEEQNLEQPAVIAIYSKTGQLMARREIESVDDIVEFNVSHYPAGQYIANVKVGKNKPQSRCFIVVE